MQHLQAEGRRRVREEDWEGVFGIQKKLRRVIPLLKAILDTQRQREVKHEVHTVQTDITGPVEAKYSEYKKTKTNRHQKPVYISCFCCLMFHTAEMNLNADKQKASSFWRQWLLLTLLFQDSW